MVVFRLISDCFLIDFWLFYREFLLNLFSVFFFGNNCALFVMSFTEPFVIVKKIKASNFDRRLRKIPSCPAQKKKERETMVLLKTRRQLLQWF